MWGDVVPGGAVGRVPVWRGSRQLGWGVRSGTTAGTKSGCRGPRQDVGIAGTTPGERGGRRIRIRAWGRRARAEQRTGRWRNFAGRRRRARVGWVSETTHDARTRAAGNVSPDGATRGTPVTRWAGRWVCLSCDSCLP